MMREIFLLRHGKADRPEGVADFDRPLKKRGRQDSKWIGRWLLDRKVLPDLVLSSPALRTLQTAQLVCKQLAIDAEAIVLNPDIYEAEATTLLSILKNCPNTARKVLLVGHNPGLEELLLKLVGSCTEPLPDDASRLSTAAMVQVVFKGSWDQLAEGGAKWVTLIRPDRK
ncbi:MAG: histidine phosphatase family protein [Methylococcaceae bacterium]|nr:histidine phosphatase family protein [Methylococcaceae bacterium]